MQELSLGCLHHTVSITAGAFSSAERRIASSVEPLFMQLLSLTDLSSHAIHNNIVAKFIRLLSCLVATATDVDFTQKVTGVYYYY